MMGLYSYYGYVFDIVACAGPRTFEGRESVRRLAMLRLYHHSFFSFSLFPSFSLFSPFLVFSLPFSFSLVLSSLAQVSPFLHQQEIDTVIDVECSLWIVS